ncbi:hypothetical protein G6F31_017475 [Rhizopus arrhizus]|nr:hypothetical protein G6F32_015051 [Rhizopus arrhizus]KAG0929081.1 hypothetical protein G6F31_017475 [Rhizopus arrhizus]
MQRVRVDDAVHVRPRAVDPGMEAVGRVGHAAALLHAQVFVHHQQVAGRDLVKAQTQPLRVVPARLRRPRSDLPSQPGIVPAVEQDAASQRQALAQTPLRRIELTLHLGFRARNQFVFSQVHRIAHHVSVMPFPSTA